MHSIYENYSKKDINGNIEECIGEYIENSKIVKKVGPDDNFYQNLKLLLKIYQKIFFILLIQQDGILRSGRKK
ncbi:hypothetical protein HNQ02_003726 [Flavobacterium sp. 7E]|nr:hypothetical protein [Flavobacterium sp. 7E]